MDIFKKIKDIIASRDRKKLIENTAIAVIIGVIVIIAGSTIFSGDKQETPSKGRQMAEVTDETVRQPASGHDAAEEKLKLLLSQIQGVGKVDVMITYETSGEEVPVYDVSRNKSATQEKDNEGGTRSITGEEYDSKLAYEDSPGGGKIPVIIKEIEPEVRGVLVVAEGADSVTVKERILSAVTVVLDIPVHKVQVAQRKK